MPDYMYTYSGLEVDPMNPRVEDIRLGDIAHALSLLCRGGGHMKHFYSVGQHSVNCAVEARARGMEDRVVLACLLHDASEAYISDIIRPVKAHLPDYLLIEKRLQDTVWEAFCLRLTPGDMELVTLVDNAMLANEIPALMRCPPMPETPALLGCCDFSLRQSGEVEAAFTAWAERYYSGNQIADNYV